MSGGASRLTELPIFALLGDEERGTLEGLLSRVRLGRGENIFAYGDPGDSVYVVSKGRVQIFMEDLEGQRIVLNENGPGSVFGEISLLDGGPRTAGAMALVDTELMTLDRDDLLEFVTRHPQAAIALLTVMGQRLRSTNELLRTHTSRNMNDEDREHQSSAQRATELLCRVAGSWGFLAALLLGLSAAVFFISRSSSTRFQGMTPPEWLMVGLLGISATVSMLILMSRNRQAAKDRLQADIEYQFNLKAELDLASLNRKLDALAERIGDAPSASESGRRTTVRG